MSDRLVAFRGRQSPRGHRGRHAPSGELSFAVLDVAVGSTRGTTWLVAPPARVTAPVDGLPHGAEPLPDLLEMLGVSPAPPGPRRAVRRRPAPNVAIASGSTEANLVATGPAALLGEGEAACGWVVPGVEVEVVGEADRALAHADAARLNAPALGPA